MMPVLTSHNFFQPYSGTKADPSAFLLLIFSTLFDALLEMLNMLL
jgi:hypothetical protein